SKTQVERQFRRHLPVVLNEGRVKVVAMRRVYQLVYVAPGGLAEKEGRKLIPRDSIAAQWVGLGVTPIEVVLPADKTQRNAVFVEAFGLGADLQDMPATDYIQVGLQAVGVIAFEVARPIGTDRRIVAAPGEIEPRELKNLELANQALREAKLAGVIAPSDQVAGEILPARQPKLQIPDRRWRGSPSPVKTPVHPIACQRSIPACLGDVIAPAERAHFLERGVGVTKVHPVAPGHVVVDA